MPWLASVLMVGGVVSGCAADARTLDPHQIEQLYGVAGAYTWSIATPAGPMQGTIVPITLADGRTAQLVIPQRQASDVRSVYLADTDGLHQVQLKEHASRQDVIGAPAIVQRRSEPQPASKRSWEKEALIIGGSADHRRTRGTRRETLFCSASSAISSMSCRGRRQLAGHAHYLALCDDSISTSPTPTPGRLI